MRPVSKDKPSEQKIRRGRLLFEGQSKRIFESSETDKVYLEFKNEFSGSARKDTVAPSKPTLAAEVAAHIFDYLQSFRIPTHFVERQQSANLLVRRLDMIPIAVVVRNIAAGSLCERYGVTEGRELDFPVVELVYRNRQYDYPIINESHILALGVSTPDEVRSTVRIATKTNAVLRSFMERRRFRLVDLWLEFGRQNGEVFLGDAIIPDVMRVLDVESSTIHDGTRFRLGIGDYTDTYTDLSKRFLS